MNAHVSDRNTMNRPFHYTLYDPDNVFLLNGYAWEEGDYGETLSVENLDELHKSIALSIVKHDRWLNGKEFRFLRLELGATQKIVADWMDVDVQTVARWEKGETEVNPVAGRLIRLICLENIDADFSITALLEQLSEMDVPETDVHNFAFNKQTGWRWTHAA